MPATPRPVIGSYAWVPSCHLSRHVRHLAIATGTPWRVIALLAGVPSATVGRMISAGGRPRARIRAIDAERLLSLTPGAVMAAQDRTVPAVATVRRIRALAEAGHSHRQIARYLDLTDAELDLLAAGDLPSCSLMVRLRAQAACEAHGLWWPEPSDREV